MHDLAHLLDVRVPQLTGPRRDNLPTDTRGNTFRVGIFLDFVKLTIRTPHGGASYVQGAKRNRIDTHRGGTERLETRTSSLTPNTFSVMSARPSMQLAMEKYLLAGKSGDNISGGYAS